MTPETADKAATGRRRVQELPGPGHRRL